MGWGEGSPSLLHLWSSLKSGLPHSTPPPPPLSSPVAPAAGPWPSRVSWKTPGCCLARTCPILPSALPARTGLGLWVSGLSTTDLSSTLVPCPVPTLAKAPGCGARPEQGAGLARDRQAERQMETGRGGSWPHCHNPPASCPWESSALHHPPTAPGPLSGPVFSP